MVTPEQSHVGPRSRDNLTMAAPSMGSAYGQHWDRLHYQDGRRTVQEWHTSWAAVEHLVRPYLAMASSASGSNVVVDVGCGSSSLGTQVLQSGLGLSTLLLVDAAVGLLEQLQVQQSTVSATTQPEDRPIGHAGGGHTADSEQMCNMPPGQAATHPTSGPRTLGCVELLAADCRRLPVCSGCAAVIIDKGTLDALWSDEDKVAMLCECARLLHPRGVLLSISFSSVTRLNFLQQHCPPLGLQLRVHVVGPGDPAHGHEVRFVTMLGYDFGHVEYQADALTLRILQRIRQTGSILHSDSDDTECAATGLFD